MMESKKDEASKKEQEAKKPVKNAVDLQKLKLDKLFKNIVSALTMGCRSFSGIHSELKGFESNGLWLLLKGNIQPSPNLFFNTI